MSKGIVRSARVAVCAVCGDDRLPTVAPPSAPAGVLWSRVGRHEDAEGQPCPGSGREGASRSAAWGWPAWEEMEDGDRARALVHVMRCTAPMRSVHTPNTYIGPGLAGLAPDEVCVHAWEQTGGWEAAVDRWGAAKVRGLVGALVPVAVDEVLELYGWAPGCEAVIEDGRLVGVLPSSTARRPPGWIWRQPPGYGRLLALPDRRRHVAQVIHRHLGVAAPEPAVRIPAGEGDSWVAGAVREAARGRRAVEVQVADGTWVVLRPAGGLGAA